jgi:hypothetical protein
VIDQAPIWTYLQRLLALWEPASSLPQGCCRYRRQPAEMTIGQRRAISRYELCKEFFLTNMATSERILYVNGST